MLLDRSRFLALTSLMASATGCPGPAARDAVSATDAGKPPPPGGYSPEAPEDPHPIPLEHYGPTHESEEMLVRPTVSCAPPGQPEGGSSAKTGLACVGAWACTGTDDLARPAPSCAEIAARATLCTELEGDYRSPRAACERTKRFLKPRIATRTLRCMNELDSSTDINSASCLRVLNDACREDALFRACPDASIAEACKAIRAACGTASDKECEAYLPGLSEAGRANVVACMKYKSNCERGMISCIDRLGEYD